MVLVAFLIIIVLKLTKKQAKENQGKNYRKKLSLL